MWRSARRTTKLLAHHARSMAASVEVEKVVDHHRNLMHLGKRYPLVAPDAYVAPNATVVGDVDLDDRVTVGYGAVLRGDLNNITIGAVSNIGDRTVVHTARTSPTGLSAVTSIGKYVTVGPGCAIRSATIEDNVIIGEKCVLGEGSLVESHAVLRPGSVVPPGRRIPSGQVWSGVPARYVRPVTNEEAEEIVRAAEAMFLLSREHEFEFLPYGTLYQELEKLREATGTEKE